MFFDIFVHELFLNVINTQMFNSLVIYRGIKLVPNQVRRDEIEIGVALKTSSF